MDDGGALDADQIGDAPPSDVLAVEGTRGVRLSGRAIGSVATVLALLVGGVVVVTALSGDTGQEPESLLPGTSYAFAKLDLDPPSDQAGAFGAFAGRFPTAKSKSSDELRERAVTKLIRNWHLDYAKDVKPWLGRRAAVAGFPDAAGKSKVVYVLQTTDAAAAKAAFAKLPEPLAVDTRGGYLVVAEDQTVLRAALKDADASALSEDADFKADIAKLDADQVVVGWIDNKAAVDVMLADSPQDSADDPFIAELRKYGVGRSVVGIHAAKNYVEISGVTTGAPAMPVGSPLRMTTLPDDSIGAAYWREPSATLNGGITGFGLAGQFAARLPGGFLYGLGALGGSGETITTSSGSASAFPCPVPPSPAAGAPTEYSCEFSSGPDATMSFAPPCPPDGQCITYAATATAAAPSPDALSAGSCTEQNPCAATMSSAPEASPHEGEVVSASPLQDEEIGVFNVVGELAAQLSSDTTLVLGTLPVPGGKRSPDAAVIGQVADPTKAEAAAKKVADELSRQFEEKPSVAVHDGVLTMASDATYAQKLTGTLGKTELFTTAMGELGSNVQLAVFANLERVRDAVPGYPQDWRPVSAIGFSLARNGSDNVLRVRIVSR